jgi:hypothetical protein
MTFIAIGSTRNRKFFSYSVGNKIPNLYWQRECDFSIIFSLIKNTRSSLSADWLCKAQVAANFAPTFVCNRRCYLSFFFFLSGRCYWRQYVKRMNRVLMFSNWIYISYCLMAENQPLIKRTVRFISLSSSLPVETVVAADQCSTVSLSTQS